MEKNYKLYHGDCLDKLKELEDNSIDSIVTDPPYGLAFMGKKWDYDVPSQQIWEECLRVLKPGGHLLAFAGSRTYHRMAVRIEDAGFEIRDQIMWVYGSGFPKSHNIGKAVDKLQGNDREVVGSKGSYRDMRGGALDPNLTQDRDRLEIMETKGNSPYEGWGTALKPAHEPIVMARKPFKGSVAENVLEWGTGGINVDGCRISTSDNLNGGGYGGNNVGVATYALSDGRKTLPTNKLTKDDFTQPEGRFPANFILECTCDNPKIVADTFVKNVDFTNDKQSNMGWGTNKAITEPVETTKVIHTDPNCPCYILDKQSGIRKGFASQNCNNQKLYGGNALNSSVTTRDGFKEGFNDTSGASRFFYCPKANKSDRNEGCDALSNKQRPGQTDKGLYSSSPVCKDCGKTVNGTNDHSKCKEELEYRPSTTTTKNHHPTVKPTELMTYLIRLVTPKGGVVLDPFMGSGSTGKAAIREGFGFVGIEREEEYLQIAEQRIEWEYNKQHPHNWF